MKVKTVAERIVEGIETFELVMNRKSYFPNAIDNAGQPIVGGATTMTWQIRHKDKGYCTDKSLVTLGKDLQDNEVKQELIDAGWILAEDNLIM